MDLNKANWMLLSTNIYYVHIALLSYIIVTQHFKCWKHHQTSVSYNLTLWNSDMLSVWPWHLKQCYIQWCRLIVYHLRYGRSLQFCNFVCMRVYSAKVFFFLTSIHLPLLHFFPHLDFWIFPSLIPYWTLGMVNRLYLKSTFIIFLINQNALYSKSPFTQSHLHITPTSMHTWQRHYFALKIRYCHLYCLHWPIAGVKQNQICSVLILDQPNTIIIEQQDNLMVSEPMSLR